MGRERLTPPPQRPFGALLGPPPDKRRAMSESALTGQLGAPNRGAPSCCATASSPIVQRPSG
eukprot:11059809-Alexandrium_andersonii.AAC.1